MKTDNFIVIIFVSQISLSIHIVSIDVSRIEPGKVNSGSGDRREAKEKDTARHGQ